MNPSEIREWLSSGCIVPLEPRSGEAAVWLGWGESRRTDAPEAGRLSVYSPDFFLDDARPWRVFATSLKVGTRDARALVESNKPAAATQPFEWQPPDRALFQELFEDLQRHIATGELKKAVPAVFSRALGTVDPCRLARTLRAALDSAAEAPLNVYGEWDAQGGLVGATPELLFRVTGPRTISTAAVAGTRPHAASAASRLPLLEDPKEVEEHQFVVDGIRDALGALGTVHVGATRELRLSRFSHLFAPVEVCLHRTESFETIARALHPTPAVGGWPRQSGRRWLEWMERADQAAGAGSRHRFGAPFGAVTPDGEGICWVAIRGMQWTRPGSELASLCLAAGCGVTAQSSADREWHELNIKLQSIRTSLAV